MFFDESSVASYAEGAICNGFSYNYLSSIDLTCFFEIILIESQNHLFVMRWD